MDVAVAGASRTASRPETVVWLGPISVVSQICGYIGVIENQIENEMEATITTVYRVI